MMENVTFAGESGLVAVVRALENLRLMLAASKVDPEQAAGYLGCLNLHLAEAIGVGGMLRDHLEECGGLLCPQCKAYVGSISDLSSACFNCGATIFPEMEEEQATPSIDADAAEAEAR